MFSIKVKQYAGIGALLLLAACGGDKKKDAAAAQQGPQAIPVSLQAVKVTNAVYYDEYPGTLAALNQIDLRPQVSGFVTGVHFKDGDRVRKGQLLYSIDQQLYQANYQQAVANMRVQEANLVKAQKDADRYHELDKKDAVAKQLVDNADAALEVAKKQVDASNANIQAVQTNVRYTRVTAPFDGVIGISQVKVGAPVSAGSTIMNTISTDGEMAVDFSVDQKEIYRFSNYKVDGTKPADSTFRLSFSNEMYPYPGKIYLIDRAVDPQTGTIKTRLVFPNTKKLLVAGMSGTVMVKNNSAEQAMLIPYKAITEQLGEFFVYVPGDSSKVSQKKVVLGKQIGTDVIIKQGLQATDSVVVQGVQNLHEGSMITTAPPKAPAAGAAPAKK